MKHFLSYKNIIWNQPSWHKCRLCFRYMFRKAWLQSLAWNLRNDFVSHITKAYKPKFCHPCRSLCFRNHANICIIEPWIYLPSNQKIINQVKQILFNNRLRMLEKRAVIPSGPGAFFGCIINKARFTSSSVALLNKIWFIWGVIVGVISLSKSGGGGGGLY